MTASSIGSSLEPARVLVVDDTDANRYAVARVLRNAGLEVLEAATGREGLRMTRSEQPDLLLLDVKLPDMLGFEVTDQLKSSPETAHIIILNVSASYTDVDSQVLGLGRGADAYLLHPIEPAVLVATVRALLRLRNAERRLAALLSERDALTAQLEQALHVRDEFLSMATHELRGPLHALMLRLESLRRSYALDAAGVTPEKAESTLRASIKQIDRLVRLLEDLLDISRMTESGIRLELEDVDLSEVVRDVAERMSDQCVQVGCEVLLHASAPVVGRWDRMRLDQVFTNLLSNALRYSAGKPIEVHVTGDGERAVLVVRDQGVGISPEHRQRIFERFERVESDRTGTSFGLGLWIVHRIVDALGGRADVESELGKGATFSVELPQAGPIAHDA
jgi:signal transduction histidine kinase